MVNHLKVVRCPHPLISQSEPVTQAVQFTCQIGVVGSCVYPLWSRRCPHGNKDCHNDRQKTRAGSATAVPESARSFFEGKIFPSQIDDLGSTRKAEFTSKRGCTREFRAKVFEKTLLLVAVLFSRPCRPLGLLGY
jgi:hypothetical protein